MMLRLIASLTIVVIVAIFSVFQFRFTTCNKIRKDYTVGTQVLLAQNCDETRNKRVYSSLSKEILETSTPHLVHARLECLLLGVSTS